MSHNDISQTVNLIQFRNAGTDQHFIKSQIAECLNERAHRFWR
jgi:hypothetical protein